MEEKYVLDVVYIFVTRVIMTEECRKSTLMCNYDDIGEFERDFIGLTTEVRKTFSCFFTR